MSARKFVLFTFIFSSVVFASEVSLDSPLNNVGYITRSSLNTMVANMSYPALSEFTVWKDVKMSVCQKQTNTYIRQLENIKRIAVKSPNEFKILPNMWNVIITLIFCIFAMVIILSLKGRRKRILGNRIPGPAGLFVLGNFFLFAKGPKSFVKNLMREYRIYEKSLFKVWMLNRLLIIPSTPEDIKKVLQNPKCIKKCAEYSVFQEGVGGLGIFANNNIDEWRKNRKLVIKGLVPTKLKSFIPTFFQEAKVLSEILLEKRDFKSNDCDISHPIEMATMEMIGKNALGVTFNTQREGRNKFVEALHNLFHIKAYRMLQPWLMNNIIFNFSTFKRKYDLSQKWCTEFVDEIINSRVTESNQIGNAANVNTADDDSCEDSTTILDILLQHYPQMSLEQIRDEVVTVISAGQDTGAMAIACAVSMLAHHPDVQNHVFEELQSIFSTDDFYRQPSYEDLQQMTYLERVIKETLRLFPSAPMFGKTNEEDVEVGGYLCPAGSTFMILPAFLHRSPLYFTEPNKFNPDNFLPDVCSSRHPFSYIPFSGGFRGCVGDKYAFIQMKTVLSTLVRRLEFFPSDRYPKPENLKVAFSVTLKFVGGCHLKVVPRIL